MYQQIKCSSNFFTLLRVLDSIQQILRFGKGSVLAPARGATTCDAWTGPKCSGTPRGCQGRGGGHFFFPGFLPTFGEALGGGEQLFFGSLSLVLFSRHISLPFSFYLS